MNPILRLLQLVQAADAAAIENELARYEAVQHQLEEESWHLQLDLARALADCLALATEAAQAAFEARCSLEEAAQVWDVLQEAVQGCESLVVGHA